jgi:hypothetical protein
VNNSISKDFQEKFFTPTFLKRCVEKYAELKDLRAVKFPPCLIMHHAMKMYGGVEA